MMKKSFLAILILLFSYGCSEKPSLSLEMLKNIEYKGIYDKPVKLTDGTYEGEPFVEGGSSRESVHFVDSLTRFGDLNGDGINDAIVILLENSGGSGVFIYMAVVLSQDEKAINVATKSLSDRTQIESISINSKEIVLTLLTHGPDDPMCCPSQKEIKKYELEDGVLITR